MDFIRLYVRGRDEVCDDYIISVRIETWDQIKEAVQDYNDHFGFTGECIIGEIPSPVLPEELFTL